MEAEKLKVHNGHSDFGDGIFKWCTLIEKEVSEKNPLFCFMTHPLYMHAFILLVNNCFIARYLSV